MTRSFFVQAAKTSEAARRKQGRGGTVGVPDANIDADDILALSAVSFECFAALICLKLDLGH